MESFGIRKILAKLVRVNDDLSSDTLPDTNTPALEDKDAIAGGEVVATEDAAGGSSARQRKGGKKAGETATEAPAKDGPKKDK